MALAVKLRVIEGGAEPRLPTGEAPTLPVPDLALRFPPAEPKRPSLFGVFLVASLLVHGAIFAAAMNRSPFDEERSAGGSESAILLDGVELQFVDSLPSAPSLSTADLPEATAISATAIATSVTADSATAEVADTAATEVAELAAPAPDEPAPAAAVREPVEATAEAAVDEKAIPADDTPPAAAVAEAAASPASPASENTPPVAATETAATPSAPATVEAQPVADAEEIASDDPVAPVADAAPVAARPVPEPAKPPVHNAAEAPAPVTVAAATVPDESTPAADKPASAAAPASVADAARSVSETETVAAEPVEEHETAAPPPEPRRQTPVKQARHREPPRRNAAAKAPPPAASSASSPASEARNQAQSPAAGTDGGGGTNRDALGRASASSYRSALASHLRRFKIYPPEARRKRIEGVALVAFSLDGGGRVTGVSLRRSSGAAILDTEALAMVRRASPFPAPPAELRDRFPTTVPIEFEIR